MEDNTNNRVNSNKIVKTLLYMACACIVAFYLFVIYLGFQPRVSEQYRAYYIDHTISRWPG